jgi:hypothetical protein
MVKPQVMAGLSDETSGSGNIEFSITSYAQCAGRLCLIPQLWKSICKVASRIERINKIQDSRATAIQPFRRSGDQVFKVSLESLIQRINNSQPRWADASQCSRKLREVIPLPTVTQGYYEARR